MHIVHQFMEAWSVRNGVAGYRFADERRKCRELFAQ